jgi:beta-mannosidase
MVVERGETEIGLGGATCAWRCCAHPPGTISHPSQLNSDDPRWLPATVPGTVASTLAASNQWSFDNPPDIDASDWWFQTRFQAGGLAGHHPAHLHFDGLATLADVWINGELVLTSDNMFRSHCVDISAHLRDDNELTIVFRSLTADLARKRPRPRWKTNLVNHQQLRWHRTSLQGRIPGWSPPAPAIGPWRAIRLETGPITPHALYLRPRLQGTTGFVTLEARLLSSTPILRAELKVGDHVQPLRVDHETDGYSLHGELQIPSVRKWWPHTHGQPALYDCELILETRDSTLHTPCAPVGFRELDVNRNDQFQVRINDEAIYCRGACWTVSDILTLTGTDDQLRHDLTLARDAGINMLRVGGTMVYESDRFYQLCDALGILVWQDFMFANMDYPVDDESFRHNISVEVTEQIARLAAHPCVTVYCGNSEIEQQAAMLGMPREVWTNSWFSEILPEFVTRLHPGTAYVPSTPTGGVLPFQPDTGLTHYYGVGAYLRPTTDVRRSNVKFTPECLGFSNIPEPSTIEAIMQGAMPVAHDPRWKRRVPRDTGAGWDFEDVRDHYLRDVFQVDPVQLRSRDMPRYLQLSRLVTGEMMQQAFSEWRSSHSHNGGGLVWFYKDLWPAAGWGLVDSTGIPKAAYYFLKRVWGSRQLVITDEGLNGLHLHLVNETVESCHGTLELTLLKEPNIVVARKELATHVDARSCRAISADEVLGGFYDVSYAYRFGPPHHDVVIATWLDEERRVISDAFHFLQRRIPSLDRSIVLDASVEMASNGDPRIVLHSDRLLQGVQLAARGYLPDDNYFHLPPNHTRVVTFRSATAQRPPFKASIEALNMDMVTVRSPGT